jgi:hypothetical protein
MRKTLHGNVPLALTPMPPSWLTVSLQLAMFLPCDGVQLYALMVVVVLQALCSLRTLWRWGLML